MRIPHHEPTRSQPRQSRTQILVGRTQRAFEPVDYPRAVSVRLQLPHEPQPSFTKRAIVQIHRILSCDHDAERPGPLRQRHQVRLVGGLAGWGGRKP